MDNSNYDDQVLMGENMPDLSKIEEAIPLIIFNEERRSKCHINFVLILLCCIQCLKSTRKEDSSCLLSRVPLALLPSQECTEQARATCLTGCFLIEVMVSGQDLLSIPALRVFGCGPNHWTVKLLMATPFKWSSWTLKGQVLSMKTRTMTLEYFHLLFFCLRISSTTQWVRLTRMHFKI